MNLGPLALALLMIGATSDAGVAQDSAAATSEGVSQTQSDRDRVYTGDRTIEEGETVGDIVVVGGDLRVRGEVTGDAVVINGDLILEDSGVILGDALVTAGELVNRGGRVRGEMRALNGSGIDISAAAGAATATATLEVDRDAAASRSSRSDRRRSGLSAIGRGIAGIISTIALGLVLAGIGAALVFYGRPYLETVSDTVRGATTRSALTGLAATFLAIPAFVVLVVALAVSIVGLPFLLVAIPLYPVALFGAGAFGLLGVAHAIGERTTEQTRDAVDFRFRNSYAYLFTGLMMLLLPHIAAHLIGMTGFLEFIGQMLRGLTWLAIWVAATVGFGAVILSRGGRRRTFAAAIPTEPGGFEAEDFFDDDAFGGPSDA